MRAARGALEKAGMRGRRLQAVCLGLAGVDRPTVRRRMLIWLRRSIPAQSHMLTTDAAIALSAALGRSAGIVVISGTGSISYGQDERGRVLRAGGWGTPFDDVGSGYDLGHRAVSAALRAVDGRGPRTLLTKKLCRALRLRDITEIVLRHLSPPQVAALFPYVLEAAEEGDRVARSLCEQAGHDLAGLALALLRRFRWPAARGWRRRAVRVVCAGGVFQSSALVRRSFARRVREQAPRARVSLLRRVPVEGALALARGLPR